MDKETTISNRDFIYLIYLLTFIGGGKSFTMLI